MTGKKKASMRLKKPRKVQATNGSGKSQRHEMDIRIEFTEQLLASGLRYRATAKQVMAEYEVSISTAEAYIKRVYLKWSAEEKEDRPLKKRRATERVREVFMRALEAGDHGAAIRAAELLAKMEGVAPEQVVKIDGEMTAKLEIGEDLEVVLGAIMKDPKQRKMVMKKIAPSREDKANEKPSRRKGRRTQKDR